MLLRKIIFTLFLIIGLLLLTLFTQVGGLILLSCFPIFYFLKTRILNLYFRFLANLLVFLGVYLVFNLFLIPVLAKPFGRVPLPTFAENHLKPLIIGTCLFNRHYVTSEMKKLAEITANQLNTQFPGTELSYLDANFPFFKFPLFPHITHNDGKKLDIALLYRNTKTGKIVNDAPSSIGYGVCENPQVGEINMTADCEKQGFWQYNFMSKYVISQKRKKDFTFDAERTKFLIKTLVEKPETVRIFIEPHLKIRLGLMRYQKIQFHGCHAVRHDDHIHLQIR